MSPYNRLQECDSVVPSGRPCRARQDFQETWYMEPGSRDSYFFTTQVLGGLLAVLLVLVRIPAYAASVKPGDLISPENAETVADLVSPGNFALVKQGMRLKIVPTDRLEWPAPYRAATEKYSA